MILLINSKITAHRGLNYRQEENPNHPQNNRMDVFKYCLSAFEKMKPILSKVFLYIEVSSEFSDRRDELENYIKELFPPEMLVLNWYRNNFKSDWLNVCEEINKVDDDVIWHSGNDDHIFIDSSLDVLKEGIELIKNDNEMMSQMSFSHTPEMIKVASYLNGELTESGNYVKIRWRNTDGIHIVKKDRFLLYWKHICEPDKLNFRPDGICDFNNPICTDELLVSNVYVPTRELVRHFDGYGHVGKLNNISPPLFIPQGFFENNIKIKYGFKERDNEYTNFNPSSEFLYAYSNNGTDYRWCLEDIPLFWRDKIKEILTNPEDEKELKNNRNKYFLDLMKNNINVCFGFIVGDKFPPNEWFKNHML